MRIAGGGLSVARGEPDGADLVLSGPATAIAGLIYGGVPAEALESEGAIAIEGDRALLARFVTLFPLPEKFAPRA